MSKKITAKQVICEGLLKGRKVEKILEQVQKKVPDSKADESHVRYYVNYLYKAGEMNDEQKAKYIKGRGRPAAKTAKADKPAKKAKADKPAKAKKVKADKPAKKVKTKKVKKTKKSASKKD